jgi:hypothetical protein
MPICIDQREIFPVSTSRTGKGIEEKSRKRGGERRAGKEIGEKDGKRIKEKDGKRGCR